MNCLVTAGPTYEPLDQVRRVTNSSTGRLGTELANYLTVRGHNVVLLIGEQSTWPGEQRVRQVQRFSTTADLSVRVEALATTSVDAVFHAAAVSDFAVGKIWSHAADGELIEVQAGKISSRLNRLLVELVPTLKIISHLRAWFPRAVLVGWKYEVDGHRGEAVRKAAQQIVDCRTNASVVNGPAYGAGFGLVTGGRAGEHFATAATLYTALEKFMATR